MGLKNAIAAALCTGLLMSGGAALADEYRADQFLGLDLSQAVLSPKRLGPETQFAPVRIEARTDRRPVKTERVVVAKEAAPKPQVAQENASRNRAPPPAPSWRGVTATRSTHRRATPASRNGRARPAASAAGRTSSLSNLMVRRRESAVSNHVARLVPFIPRDGASRLLRMRSDGISRGNL